MATATKKLPKEDKPLPEGKAIEFDIRNNIFYSVLNWCKLPGIRSRFRTGIEEEPRDGAYWYQRQQRKLYLCIYSTADGAVKDSDGYSRGYQLIAHYHFDSHKLELFPVPTHKLEYIQKIMDNQFYAHVDAVKAEHVARCFLSERVVEVRPPQREHNPLHEMERIVGYACS